MLDDLGYILPTLFEGVAETVILTVAGAVLALLLSFAAGLASRSRPWTVRFFTRLYVEGWRGTSEVVQLFLVFFVVPTLNQSLKVSPITAGIIVLGLNFGAYGSEIVRGAVQSVPAAQYEGATALNLTSWQRMRKVVLPQATAEMIPPFNNLLIQLLKGSALVSFIFAEEITYQGKDVLVPMYPANPFIVWIPVLLYYFALALLITGGMRWLEGKANAAVGKQAKPRTRLRWENRSEVAT